MIESTHARNRSVNLSHYDVAVLRLVARILDSAQNGNAEYVGPSLYADFCDLIDHVDPPECPGMDAALDAYLSGLPDDDYTTTAELEYFATHRAPGNFAPTDLDAIPF